MRLTGLCIANDFSPENRVFATHLRNVPPTAPIDASVICHDRGRGDVLPQRFREMPGVTTVGLDTGYRQPAAAFYRRAVTKLPRSWLLRAHAEEVTKAVAATRPDVIYSNGQIVDCRAATQAALTLGLPQVIHLHYHVGPWLGELPLQRLLECAHVITVSDFVRSTAIDFGVPPERVTTVLNTMPPIEINMGERAGVRDEFAIPMDAVVIGQVCRMDPLKGVEDTIDAFSHVARRSDETYLMLVGDGPLRKSLHQQVERAGLSHRVRFTGLRSDVPRLLAAIDIFSHPSMGDPCPLAVMEASATGIPVVAWAHGGIPEIVEHGVSGLLAPFGDLFALTQAMEQLAQDSALRLALGQAGRARVRVAFDPQAGGAKFAQVLEAVVGQ